MASEVFLALRGKARHLIAALEAGKGADAAMARRRQRPTGLEQRRVARPAVIRRAGRQGGDEGRDVLDVLVRHVLREGEHRRHLADAFAEQDHLDGDAPRRLAGEGGDVRQLAAAIRAVAVGAAMRREVGAAPRVLRRRGAVQRGGHRGRLQQERQPHRR
jgi:hypothetical protein